MSTYVNAIYPPLLGMKKTLIQQAWSNTALRHDMLRLSFLLGPCAMYAYLLYRHGDKNPAARYPGRPHIMEPNRGITMLMAWGNTCHLLGDDECHRRQGFMGAPPVTDEEAAGHGHH
eukprot:NODE_5574_length_500_cov_347.070953_g4165_i0.p1 GENE.NODE_5574_length_500_cov_347.070953_g4165_i0~~NODE_5574_length_500_cov_347.070953_g4165_i0.p1  ORF type:complete len:117 (-),score=32.38 NODE_5574_length_500_cov_347.070953_g4165_i0:92-442(-)